MGHYDCELVRKPSYKLTCNPPRGYFPLLPVHESTLPHQRTEDPLNQIVATAYLSTTASLDLKQAEADLVTIEVYVSCGCKCSPDTLIIIQCDDHPLHILTFFGKLLKDEAHVTKYLPNNSITRPSLLEFNYEKLLLVFSDCEDINGASIGRILLAYKFAFFIVDIVLLL